MKGWRVVKGGYEGWRVADSYQLSATINYARSANDVRRTNVTRSVNDSRRLNVNRFQEYFSVALVRMMLFKNNIPIKCRSCLSGIVGIRHDGHA